MATFAKKDRQRIIDEYLAATGRNMFIAPEFIDWLSEQPEHECYGMFFGKDDETAAREYRIGLARQMVSGLRIVAPVSMAPEKGSVIQITTREYPAYVSPVGGRKSGGGYNPFDPLDAEAMAELQDQGARALRSWLARYRGAAESAGVDVRPIEDVVVALARRSEVVA